MNRLKWLACPYSAMPEQSLMGWVIEIWDGASIYCAVIPGKDCMSEALDDFMVFYSRKEEHRLSCSYALYYKGSLVVRNFSVTHERNVE